MLLAAAVEATACQARIEAADPQSQSQTDGSAAAADEARPLCDVAAPLPACVHPPLAADGDRNAIHSQEIAERLRTALTSITAQLGESIELCESFLRSPPEQELAARPFEETTTFSSERPQSPLFVRQLSPTYSARLASRRSSPAVLAKKATPRDVESPSLDLLDTPMCDANTTGGAPAQRANGCTASPPSSSLRPAPPCLQDGFLAALIAGGTDQSLAQLAAGDGLVSSATDLLPQV